MVQQLSLTSSISLNRFENLRITLESLTGNKPQALSQHVVIMKPKFPFTPEPSPGKINQIESYRIRINRVWNNENFRLDRVQKSSNVLLTGESISDKSINSTKNDSVWTIQLSDIPAGGKNPVLIQNIYETTIYQTDDILGYLDELGYMPETEFWNKGCRFYYNDVIIEILRLYVRSQEDKKDIVDLVEKKENENNDHHHLHNLISLELLDKSHKYQVKCFVNVSTLNDLDNVARGVKQLENLRKELAGLIDLQIPDRTQMDSRLNSRIAASNHTRPK